MGYGARMGVFVATIATVAALTACDRTQPEENHRGVSRDQGAKADEAKRKPYPPPQWKRIRDDAAQSEPVDGVVAHTRTLRGRITSQDSLGIAVNLKFADTSRRDRPDFDLGNAEFHIEQPGGKVVVLSTNKPQQVNGTLLVNANGVGRYDKISP